MVPDIYLSYGNIYTSDYFFSTDSYRDRHSQLDWES